MDTSKLEEVYWNHFVTDYKSHPSDRSANWYRTGVQAAVCHLLGDEVWNAFYARFTERRIKALEAGELMPYSNLAELRRRAKQTRKAAKTESLTN